MDTLDELPDGTDPYPNVLQLWVGAPAIYYNLVNSHNQIILRRLPLHPELSPDEIYNALVAMRLIQEHHLVFPAENSYQIINSLNDETEFTLIPSN